MAGPLGVVSALVLLAVLLINLLFSFHLFPRHQFHLRYLVRYTPGFFDFVHELLLTNVLGHSYCENGSMRRLEFLWIVFACRKLRKLELAKSIGHGKV